MLTTSFDSLTRNPVKDDRVYSLRYDMKYRIIRKKLKKSKLLDLWLRSDYDWLKVFQETQDESVKIIAADFSRYNWLQILKVGEQMGFGYRVINRFYNEYKPTV